MWQRVDAGPATYLDLRLVCRGTRPAGYRQKQNGKVRNSSILAIQTLSYQSKGTCDSLLSLLGSFSFLNLGVRFCFRGRVITPHVSNQ
jgi:hypothetical protein